MNIINNAWEFPSPFDFIHLRMLGELLPSSTIGTIYDALSPGGWLQISEWVQVLQCANHSVEGTALAKWDRAYQRGRFSSLPDAQSPVLSTNSHTALIKMGIPVTSPFRYEDLLHRAGFRRIHVKHADEESGEQVVYGIRFICGHLDMHMRRMTDMILERLTLSPSLISQRTGETAIMEQSR